MSELVYCIMDYRTIAVTGMCKNAGKTTTVNYLIKNLHEQHKLALTSIGYDGEETDEITMLEKPRVDVFPGMLVATCKSCLDISTAGYKTIMKTGILTVLGEILVVEIMSLGIMEISGPSMVAQLIDVCNIFNDLGCGKIIVDGSAERQSFASSMDCTILASGAAVSPDMNKVIRMTEYQCSLYAIPLCSDIPGCRFNENRPYETIVKPDEAILIFRGPLVDEDLLDIMKKHKGIRKRAIVNDAASIFITQKTFRSFIASEGLICVRKKINLAAVTINPMSPYGSWFDKELFLREMTECLGIPVFNILEVKV
ncbi:MAG: hypothetical protein JXN10_05230 [Clostridia bacterium]|nr:hypothetical protein [Clostridia bacterium]MBN2882909.1 hypothetical protein [Clostridia bacterium]